MYINFNGTDLEKTDLTILASKPFYRMHLSQSKADLSQLRGCELSLLSLRDNQYESTDLAPLAGSRIGELKIDKNPLLDDRVATILLSIKNLKYISLEDTSLTAEGYAILAKHPSLEMIKISPKPAVVRTNQGLAQGQQNPRRTQRLG